MYRVSEGFNLDSNDKTYFDKYGVMDLIQASRSMSSQKSLGVTQSDNLSRYKNSTSALNIIKKTTEEHFAGRSNRDGDNETDRISSVNSNNEPNIDSHLAKIQVNDAVRRESKNRYKSILERSVFSAELGYQSNDVSHMSLEERILRGVYQA